MAKQYSQNSEGSPASFPTRRDLLAVVFRHPKLIIFSFLGVLLGTALALWLPAKQYETRMKFLVRRERVDPVVTVEANSMPRFGLDVTEEQLRSEVELLKSRDLLEKAAVASGVIQSDNEPRWASVFPIIRADTADSGEQETNNRGDLQQAVRDLEERLRVEPLGKTNLIVVTYNSPDPQQGARLLNNLAELYVEKHLAVHRAGGTFDFFQQETDRYRQGLSRIEARLADFSRAEEVVSAPLEKELVIRKFSESDNKLRETQAAISETEERIRSIEGQLASTSDRLTTQVRSLDNHELLQNLKSTLLNLQLKRTGLLRRYAPSYPAVMEVNEQIAQTHAAIAAAGKSPLQEETSDRNPLHEMLNAELSKSRAELAALKARAVAAANDVRGYRQYAQRLDQKQMLQQDLLRTARAEEENYLLYSRKREEARIADALDQKRILNVSLVEAATVSSLSSSSPTGSILLLGLLLATLISIGLALAADYWDPTFRTPDEVRAFLDIPVLASIPRGVSHER